MNISFVSPIFGAATLRFNTSRLDDFRTSTGGSQDHSARLKPVLSSIVSLREHMQTLKDTLMSRYGLLGASTAGRRSAVSLHSGQPFGLTLTQSAATLRSSEEINSLTTSYNPFGPSFSGSSTSEPTLSGVYDGSDGDETYTFKVKKEGNVGGPFTGKKGLPADLKVEVRRSDGSKLQDISFSELIFPDTAFDLDNGLKVSFSSGSLEKDDTFEVHAYTSIPSAVDPNKPLDGTRNDNPNLEYPLQVIPGTFKLNDFLINVGSGDSINDVLGKINSSGAGVTAIFDTPNERISLTQNTAGLGGQIQFSDDNTGFLAAMKLDSANVVPGEDNELSQPLDQVAAFSGIQSGTFSINQVEFNIDTATDSMNDIIESINSSGTGVTANFINDQVVIQGNSSNTTIALDDGTSQFFTGSQIATGTFQPKLTGQAASKLASRDLAEELKESFNDLAERIRDVFGVDQDPFLKSESLLIRQSLREAVESTLTGSLGFTSSMLRGRETLESNLGFDFTLSDHSDYLLHTSGAELNQVLSKSPDELFNFLFAEQGLEDKDGLLPGLIKALSAVEQNLTTKIGSSTGVFLDVLA